MERAAETNIYLKEYKIDEVENEPRAIEPEKVVSRLNHGHALHHLAPLLNSHSHSRYYHLQLRPYH